jgi:hypothetical protein
MKANKVDLEKEIKKVQREYKTIEEYEGYPCTMYANDIEWIAKHFFKLGVNTSNPLTWKDIKLIWNITDEMDNMPEEEFYKEVLKRFKAQKGE